MTSNAVLTVFVATVLVERFAPNSFKQVYLLKLLINVFNDFDDFSGCEILQNAATRRAKSLGVDVKKVRTPRCSRSGGFEPIQCDNEIVSSCWCVNEQGFELAGTRAPAAGLVNCTGE